MSDLITIKLEAVGNGNADLGHLGKALELLQRLLADADSAIEKDRTIEYEVVSVKHGTNYDVQLAPKGVNIGASSLDAGVKKLAQVLRGINEGTELPTGYTRRRLKHLTRIRELQGIFQLVRVPVEGGYVNVDPQEFANATEKILSQNASEEFSQSSLIGKILQWNGEDGKLRFGLVPGLGPRRVLCVFAPSQNDKVVQGINKFVEVTGIFVYRSGAQYPYKVLVDEVEVLDQQLKIETLRSLKNAAPNCTGGLSSEEYLKLERDDDDY